MARRTDWLIKYKASKDTGCKIFKQEIYDWSRQQTMFYQWLIVYFHYLFELPSKERPSQRIVENDTLFDNWLREKDLESRGLLHNQSNNKMLQFNVVS